MTTDMNGLKWEEIMLSNEDIIREMGKGILVHPLNVSNIRGNSLNLSASALAWSVNGGEFELDDYEEYKISSGTKKKYPNNKNDKKFLTSSFKSIVHKDKNGNDIIIIPANDTALIETEEVISVNYRIGGTYHSKVGLVTQGIGHIGTTLDPGYTGQSLIAIHNHSKNPIIISVGDTFVTVVFYYLKSSSTYPSTNSHGHVERLTELGIKLNKHQSDTLNLEWKKSRKMLLGKMKSSGVFKAYKKEVYNLYKDEKKKNIISLFVSLVAFSVVLLMIIYASIKIDAKYFVDSKISITNWVLNVGLSGFGVIVLVNGFNLLRMYVEEVMK